MDELNEKVQLTKDRELFWTQAVGVYGYNPYTDKMNIINSTNDGRLTVDVAQSVIPTDAATLTEQKKQTGILNDINNGTNDINNVLTDINDGLVIKGNTKADGSGNDYNVVVDSDGHLQVDIQSGGGGGIEYNDGNSLTGTITGKIILANDDQGKASVLNVNADKYLLVSDVISNDNQVKMINFLNDINDKITKGNDITLTEAQQVLIYGEVTSGTDQGKLHPIHISQAGDIQVEISGIEVKGQNNMDNSFPIVIANDQSAIQVEISDYVKGQNDMVSSFPVVIANDQSAIQVEISDYVKGQNDKANSFPVVIANDQSAIQVQFNDYVKGQNDMVSSFPVVIANDQSAIEIKKGISNTTCDQINNSNAKQTKSIYLDGTNGCVSFFGRNTNQNDQIKVQFSDSNDTNDWYTSHDLIINHGSNNEYAANFENLGVRYVRLYQGNDNATGLWDWTNFSSVR
jgi:hypothetical protein